MDEDPVVLEISSDEDVGFNWPNTEGGDSDVDWNELFVNLESDVGDNNKTDPKRDEGYDSDDVVVIGEVLAKPMRAKKILVAQEEEDDDDDDCIVLEGDPDKPVEEAEDLGCDSDDLVIVAEKGQIACRDYPHSRHLCVKFPFGSTQHSDHCNLCHCYVCDSPAPCIMWGNGNSVTDHCHAFEKEALWDSERKKARYGGTAVVTAPVDNTAAETAFWKDLLGQIPANVHPPTHNSGSNGYVPGHVPSYDPPNIIRTQRLPSVSGKSRYQPSQQILNPCSNNLQRPRIPTLNPQSVTSNLKRPRPTGRATAASFPIPAYKHARSNSSFTEFKHTASNHLQGIGLSSKQTDARQLHMGQLNGMVNSNPLHNPSAVNSSQLYAGHIASFGQAQLYGQPPAPPIGNPFVHPNGSQNEHISTPVSSTTAQYNPFQPDISFTAALNAQGGDQLPLTEAEDQSWNGVNADIPNWGLLENQGLHNLPVLDPEDGIYAADNLWSF